MSFSLLKHKKATGIFAIFVIVSAIAIVGIGSIGAGLPHIIFDGHIEDDEPGSERHLDGHMSYDMVIRYADGSSENFSKNIQLPDVKFALASLFADSAKTKEITGIDIKARSEMDLPLDKLTGVNNDVAYNGKIDVFLGSNLITTKSFADTFTLAELDQPQDLYTVTVASNQINNIPSGSYDLSFQVKDDFTFVVDGQERVLTIEATPTLYYSNLQPVYAVISSTTVDVDLERIPRKDSFGEIITYASYIVVTAKGFKPNSNIFFDWEVTKTTYNANFYNNATDKTILSDATGSATDRVFVYKGYSFPKCYAYYGFVTISDGESTIGPIKLGCSNLYDDNKGIVF